MSLGPFFPLFSQILLHLFIYILWVSAQTSYESTSNLEDDLIVVQFPNSGEKFAVDAERAVFQETSNPNVSTTTDQNDSRQTLSLETSGRELEKQFKKLMRRSREKSTLGQPSDFPTEIQDSMNNFELDNEVIQIKEEVNEFKFRSSRRQRKLNAKVIRWKHEEKLDESEPYGCGYPICVLVDMRPKRFKSVCQFAGWLKEEGMTRRVFHVQKGSCEDAIEGKGHHRAWATNDGNPCNCAGHQGCATEICLNDNGHAKTFANVCQAMKYLSNKTELISAAFGLGNCRQLYGSCLFTEWFDLDEPCRGGEIESVYVTNLYASYIGKAGRHRSCSYKNIKLPAEYQTVEGEDVRIKDMVVNVVKDRITCLNEKNKNKPKPPYFWSSPEVRCRDFKMRYCCDKLWGEVGGFKNLNPNDVIVDAPAQKTLFDGCQWLNFMSVSSGKGTGDIESRQKNYPFMKKSTCKLSKFSALYIDARRVKDDLPWDETGDLITKNTPMYGFYCDNQNNHYSTGKKCSDYKVRFCCKNEQAAHWGRWSSWSECSKSCGGGTRNRNRVCVKKKGHKKGCFNGGPLGDVRFRLMEEDCNILPCPQDLQWQPWLKWSTCSVTCGKGTRKRHRACFPPKNGGKDCPSSDSKDYFQQGDCHVTPCTVPMWTEWRKWSKCSATCELGTKSRGRNCVDKANNNSPVKNDNYECPGPATHDTDCDAGLCKVDGAWTEWQNWGECNVACGNKGLRFQKRYCANPSPLHGGKKCEGIDTKEGPCEPLPNCPQHCLFSPWGDWSSCSVTCGDSGEVGTRSRNRHEAVPAKFGGLKCIGITEEAECCETCSADTKTKGCIFPCPVNCKLAEWTEWSGRCPRCYSRKTKEKIYRIKMKRFRFVEEEAQHGGKACQDSKNQTVTMSSGLLEEARPCRVDQDVPRCPSKSGGGLFWSSWVAWSVCPAECGKSGLQKRKRLCLKSKKVNGVRIPQCKGQTIQEQQCDNVCPKDPGAAFRRKLEGRCGSPCQDMDCSGGWTEWDTWSPCEKTCGVGQSARRRTCREDGHDEIKEKTCKGIQRETRKCDSGPCDKVEILKTRGQDVTGLAKGECQKDSRKLCGYGASWEEP